MPSLPACRVGRLAIWELRWLPTMDLVFARADANGRAYEAMTALIHLAIWPPSSSAGRWRTCRVVSCCSALSSPTGFSLDWPAVLSQNSQSNTFNFPKWNRESKGQGPWPDIALRNRKHALKSS